MLRPIHVLGFGEWQNVLSFMTFKVRCQAIGVYLNSRITSTQSTQLCQQVLKITPAILRVTKSGFQLILCVLQGRSYLYLTHFHPLKRNKNGN